MTSGDLTSGDLLCQGLSELGLENRCLSRLSKEKDEKAPKIKKLGNFLTSTKGVIAWNFR
jgi:hypothetical protein